MFLYNYTLPNSTKDLGSLHDHLKQRKKSELENM